MTPNSGAPRRKVGMLVGFSDNLSFVVAGVRPVLRVRRSAMWVLARGGMRWRTAVAAALAFIIHAQTCSATTRALIDIRDTVSAQDLLPSGGCESGCVRRVVDAVASVYGGIECELVVQNLLDHAGPDVMGGTLNVVHSCTDADGNLRYQGEGDCLYNVCVSAEWQDGRVYYFITVEHETTGTSKEHSVRLEAYLNEYEHLLEKGSGSMSPTVPNTVSNLQCTLGGECPTVTDCGTDATRIEVLMEDDFGDGWVGGLPGRSNSWTITQGLMEDNLETQVADGILPDGHHSSTSRVCLENGAYTFESTSIAAWSSESAWTLCGVEGGLGGSMEFQVEGGVCAVVDDSSASGPTTSTDREVDGNKICSLPEESPCAETKPGVEEVSGPSVGMYYDESCLEGGGDVSGCDGGGVSTCRLCFVNQTLWKIDFPDERLPDWGACPCCVAETLGVKCEGGFVRNITFTSPTLLEEVRDNFVQGKTATVVGLGVLLGLCWIMACCCVRSILREQDKALAFKHALASRGSVPVSAPPYDENTSTENSPPFGGGGHKASKAAVGDDSLKALETGLADVQKPPETYKKNRRYRGKINPPRSGGKNAPVASTAAVTARATPFVSVALDANLPETSQDRTPSDASWPTDPHAGASIDGNKHPRWNGSRELNAYLRRTGYDKVEATAITEGDEPAVDAQGRFKRSRLARDNGSSVVKAIKRTENMHRVLADTGHIDGRTEGEGRVGDHPVVLGAATAAAAAEHLRVSASPEKQFDVSFGDLGDLPVPPSPPPEFAPAPEPQCITTLRPGEAEGQRRPRNRSRSRSRSRRSGSGIVRIAPSDDPDLGAERNPTKLEKMDHKREQDDFAPAYGAPLAAQTPLVPLRPVAPAPPSVPQGVGRVEGRREARSSSPSPRVDADGSLEPQRGASRERREPNGQRRRQKSRDPSREKRAGRGGEDDEYEKKRGGDVVVAPGDVERGRGRVDGRDRRRAAHQDRHDHGKMERRDGSHARHEDREANFMDRSEEREGRQKPRGRDRKPRTAGNDAARHEGDPEGPRRETEAERRRRRAREEAEKVGRQQQQQRQTRRGERRPSRSKERSDETGGDQHPREEQQSRRGEDRHDRSDDRAEEPGVDPPVYDPQWSSRERSHSTRVRRENAVESRDLLTPQQMEGEPKDSGLSQDMNGGRADARAPASTVPSRTTSVMRFSNDPRARLARESSRRSRLEKQEGD